MRRVALFLIVALVAGGWLMAHSAIAADGPVSIEDIRQLRRERATHKQIMDRIGERGLGFVVDDETQRKLRGMGFTLKMVGQLKGMQAAPTAEPGVVPDANVAEKPDAHPPKPDMAGGGAPVAKPAGVRRELSPAEEQENAATAQRVKQILAKSETAVAAHPTPHITLLANPRVAARALPDLQQVETLIAARFPDPIANGVDPRAANIALLESRYEYEKWIKALVKVHQDAGLKFQSQDPAKAMLASNSVFVRGIFSVCLEGMDADAVRRRLAFSAGFQYMEQLTDNKGPDALRTGFGNLTEVMMFREPTITVLSGYTDRNIGPARARFAEMVRQRFASKRINSVTDTLAMSTRAMNLEQYADAWSFTELLASEPRNFAELVVSLEKGTDPATAIEKIYGLKDEALLKRWGQFVTGRR